MCVVLGMFFNRAKAIMSTATASLLRAFAHYNHEVRPYHVHGTAYTLTAHVLVGRAYGELVSP